MDVNTPAAQLKTQLLPLALEVSDYLRQAYQAHLQGGVDVSRKADCSFLTSADLYVHDRLTKTLQEWFPGVPVVSEEGDLETARERDDWPCYWLVDPLDGTREFVEKTGQFTVNIALMRHGQPWFGLVILPQEQCVYAGGQTLSPQAYINQQWQTCAQPDDNQTVKIVVSGRAQTTGSIRRFIKRLDQQGTDYEFVILGSAYKYCELLKHRYAIYPRYGAAGHWDTAAGQALLAAGGGAVVAATGQQLSYPSSTVIHSSFLALSSGCAVAAQKWLAVFQ